jgi:hypothetical protein
MAEVVQIKCPHCQNSLRIPADWIDRTMRCKYCQHVFQARRKAAPAPAPTNVAPAVPGAPLGNGEPFAFEGASTTLRVSKPKFKSSKFGTLALILLGGGVLAFVGVAAIAVVIMLGTQLANLFQSEPPVAQQASNPPPKDPSAVSKDPAQATSKIVPPSTNKDGPPDANPISLNPKQKSKDPDPQPKDDASAFKRTNEIYPRRALLISVNDYMLASPLTYGKPPQGDFKGGTSRAFADSLIKNLDFPRKQVAELSDKGTPAADPLRSTIEATIQDFVKTSRAQDHILLLFAGHVTETDKEAYLVPKDGKLGDTKTLIALSWLYGELAQCKARQKVLILDVCRTNPSGGGRAAAMGPMLEAKLKQPPNGVQVLAACSLKQQSLETDDGSVFLQAMCKCCDNLPTSHEYAIPLNRLAACVQAELEKATKGSSSPQTALLAGTEPVGKGPFNRSELQPPDVIVKTPPPPKVDNPIVLSIVRELILLPPTTGGKASPLSPAVFAEVPAKLLDQYKADYNSILDYRDKEAESPLRCRLARGILALQESGAKVTMRQTIPGKQPDAPFKSQIKAEQLRIAKPNYALSEALKDLIEAGEKYRKGETKRVQVLYDYVVLRMKARLVYAEEYNFALAEIMKDNVPKLEDGDKVYRLTAQEKVNDSETNIKDLVKDLKKNLPQFVKTYASTPWAELAQRDQTVFLGLAWKSAKQ